MSSGASKGAGAPLTAQMLGVDIDLLDELASTMSPEEGILWLHDNAADGCRAFTDAGIDNAAEQLRQPGIVAYLQSLIQT